MTRDEFRAFWREYYVVSGLAGLWTLSVTYIILIWVLTHLAEEIARTRPGAIEGDVDYGNEGGVCGLVMIVLLSAHGIMMARELQRDHEFYAELRRL